MTKNSRPGQSLDAHSDIKLGLLYLGLLYFAFKE